VSKKVVLLDYGSGNIRSGERALRRVGADVTVTADFDAACDAGRHAQYKRKTADERRVTFLQMKEVE